MNLEWDEEKRKRCLEDRGLDFADCAAVFAGPTSTFEDTRKCYGEVRCITIGMLDDEMILVVHTERTAATRIISMRKANEREKKAYAKTLVP